MLNLIYFNWYELKSVSANVPEGIILLTHALISGYNSVISFNESALLQKLKISYVPPHIYRTKWFIKENTGIISKFLIQEPQSYFRNHSWLYAYNNLEHKILYLYALSQRSIPNKNFFIPEDYLESKYWDNPYLKHRDKKIWFLPEIYNLKKEPKEILTW